MFLPAAISSQFRLTKCGGEPNYKGRHNEGSNVLHVDGHSKWYRFAVLYPNNLDDDGMNDKWNYWGFTWGNPKVQQ